MFRSVSLAAEKHQFYLPSHPDQKQRICLTGNPENDLLLILFALLLNKWIIILFSPV